MVRTEFLTHLRPNKNFKENKMFTRKFISLSTYNYSRFPSLLLILLCSSTTEKEMFLLCLNSTKSFPGQIRLCKRVFCIKFEYVLYASKRIRIYISFMKDHNTTDFEL